jgi:hypothetical protein
MHVETQRSTSLWFAGRWSVLGGLPSHSGNREHDQNSPYFPFLRTRIPFLQYGQA